MTRVNAPSQAGLVFSKMLFLVSHGLQTPLSAIRWGCGRLKRTGKNFTQEQKILLDGILGETRLLSKMFDWMLLLAKNEEGAHTADVQDIFIPDFLSSSMRTEDLPRVMALQITCPPDLQIRGDRTLFSAVVDAMLLAAAVGSTVPTTKVSVVTDDTFCSMTVAAPMMLSVLHDRTEADDHATATSARVVGGVPGFLLAIASSLARSCGGSLSPEERDDVIRSLTFLVPLRHISP